MIAAKISNGMDIAEKDASTALMSAPLGERPGGQSRPYSHETRRAAR